MNIVGEQDLGLEQTNRSKEKSVYNTASQNSNNLQEYIAPQPGRH
jgi:hypothetical protein